jgi:hypothetical protein
MFINSIRTTKGSNYWILLILINIMSGFTYGITFFLTHEEYTHLSSKIPESLGLVGFLSFWPFIDVISTEPLGFFIWGAILGIRFTFSITFVLIFILSLINGLSHRLNSNIFNFKVVSVSSITILGAQIFALLGFLFKAYFLTCLGILFIFWYYLLIG